jgi:hypothetical protein
MGERQPVNNQSNTILDFRWGMNSDIRVGSLLAVAFFLEIGIKTDDF